MWQLEELGRLYARVLKEKNPSLYHRHLVEMTTTYYYSAKVEKDKEADKPQNKQPGKPSEKARDESSRKRKIPGSSGAAGRYARLPS